MKVLLSLTMVACFFGATIAEEKKEAKKIDAAKLVGKWEMVKGPDELPKGTTVEMTKDGKLIVVIDIDGKKLDISGTYKVEGDKFSHKIKGPDGGEHEDTDTITTLTDDKLVLVDKDKKESEWKKVKAK